MNNKDQYQFIRSLRLPVFEGIPIEAEAFLEGITHSIKLKDFNYDSLSFISTHKFEIGDDIRITFFNKKWFKQKTAAIKITVLRASIEKDKFTFGASINNPDNSDYIQFIEFILSQLKPNHLKNLIFKNTFEIRDVREDESLHQFKILCNSIKELKDLSIDQYIDIVQKFAPFAKIEKIDWEIIQNNKNLLEVFLVSRFKVNRFNDVTKWLIGFENWKGLLSISIENRYITYHQRCSNFFKLCYSRTKQAKSPDNHKAAIAFSSNFLFIQSDENTNAWMFFKKIYEGISELDFHKFILDNEMENGFFEYIDISKSKDVLLLQLGHLPSTQDLLLISQKLKHFKGYKLIVLGQAENLEMIRHYFEQSFLIGHTQSHWRFVFANNELFSRFIEKKKQTSDAEIADLASIEPEKFYELLEEVYNKKIS